VHLGAADGKLAAELAADDGLLVHVLAAEPAALKSVRDHLAAEELYGRCSAELLRPPGLPYSREVVSLLVVEDLARAVAAGVTVAEMLRVISPGGKLAAGGTDEAGLRALLAEAGLTGAAPRRAGKLIAVTKPLPGRPAYWGHPNCSAAGHRVAPADVQPPNRLRWTGGLSYSTGGDIASGYEALRSVGGRNFYALNTTQILLPKDEKSRQVLIARDAFNGLPLWRRRADQVSPSRFVADGDRVFIGDVGGVACLDAASGKRLLLYGSFGLSGLPRQLLVHSGLLLMVWPTGIRAVDPATGNLKWKHDLEKGQHFTENYFYKTFNSVYAEGDALFFAVSNVPYWWGGPGKKPVADVKVELRSLSFADGGPRWKTDISELMKRGASVVHEMRANRFLFVKDGLLVFESTAKGRTRVSVAAYAAKDGKRLWEYSADCPKVPGYTAPPATLYAGGLVWLSVPWVPEGKRASLNRNEMVGLDPATGKVGRRFKMDEVLGCWRDLATERYFVAGRPPDFIDWRDGTVNPVDGVRSSCKVGAILANGMFYTVPNKCRCINDQIRGFVGFGREEPAEPRHPLVKGPAFGQLAGAGSATGSDDDWPTYRHDPARSCRAAKTVPAGVEQIWSAQVVKAKPPGAGLAYEWSVDPLGGDPLTGPTVAAGTVYVGDVNSHRVVALDAATGAARWSFTAGGRLDTPPTIHGGLCLFGCRDGWAYCLRAADGKLVWRLRAAPEARRIVAFGQLESIWPVFGGVLVDGDKACFASGRSSASGGIRVFAVDPASGEIRWQKIRQVRRGPGEPKKLKVPTECCGDVMVSSGGEVILASNVLWRMKLDTGAESVTHPSKPKPRILHARRGTFMLDRSWHWFGAGAYINGALHYGNLLCGGQLAAFDAKRAFLAARTCYWPTRANKGTFDSAIRAVEVAKNENVPAAKVSADWELTVPHPTQFQAMIVAGDVLCAGGPADLTSPEGGALWVVSTADGKVLRKMELASPPVPDGLAAAGGRLYVSTADGKVTCFGRK
jgi:outer membrane protein assembly factor BamB